jgi:Tfp pilus assembly protein PilF
MWPIVAALFFLQAPDFSADGLKALEANQYDAAAQAFQKAIAADPADYFAHFNLALALGFLHKDAESIAEYRKTLELKPHLYEAELNCAIVLLRQKNPTEALPLLEDASGQKAQEFRPRYYLAESQLQTGDTVKAEESYRLAIAINPQSAAAELGMAHALVRQARLADAAPHFRQAAKVDPKYRDGLLELADLYERDHQTAEALAIYREFPDNPTVQEHVGAMMLANKQYADAIPRLEQAYAKDPTAANRVALAMAYLFSENRAKALPLFEKAVEVDPANFEVRMAFARALRDERKYPAAGAQFLAALKLKPDDLGAWNDLASMLYLIGDFPQALAAFEKARALGGDTAGNCFLRAIMLDKMKQLKPALAAYQEFLKLSDGKNPDQEWQAKQRSKLLQRELDKR